MSQHDMNIANQSGLNFRNDLNNALAALIGNSNGNTAPTTTFPYMFWIDTSGSYPILKIRNAADSAWVEIGRTDQANFAHDRPFSGNAEPTTTYPYLYWVDTNGSYPILKIRNAANTAWLTIGRLDVDNLALLPLTGGTLTGAVIFSSTDYVTVPAGTTAQRPASPTNGMVRFNTTLGIFEGYNTSSWVPLDVPLTTKGDILSHNGTIPGRLAAGTDGQVLMADSTQALGVAWSNSSVADGSITNAKLASEVTARLVPMGTVIESILSTPPSGFVSAMNKTLGLSGADYNGSTYYDLYAALWDMAGISTTAGDPFRISSAKGASAVADWNAGKLISMDFETNAVFTRAKASARNLGSYEADDNKSHNHHSGLGETSGADSRYGLASVGADTVHRDIDGASGPTSYSYSVLTSSSGATEGRPKNVALNFFIKY